MSYLDKFYTSFNISISDGIFFPDNLSYLGRDWSLLNTLDKLYFISKIVPQWQNPLLTTIRFSNTLETSLSEKGSGFKSYLNKRFNNHFARSRIFIPEFSKPAEGKTVLHLHGILDAKETSPTELRRNLLKIAGRRPEPPHTQIHFQKPTREEWAPTNPFRLHRQGVFGWLQYSAKDTQRTYRMLAVDRRVSDRRISAEMQRILRQRGSLWDSEKFVLDPRAFFFNELLLVDRDTLNDARMKFAEWTRPLRPDYAQDDSRQTANRGDIYTD